MYFFLAIVSFTKYLLSKYGVQSIVGDKNKTNTLRAESNGSHDKSCTQIIII